MSGNLSVQGSGNKLIGTFKPIAKTLTGNITQNFEVQCSDEQFAQITRKITDGIVKQLNINSETLREIVYDTVENHCVEVLCKIDERDRSFSDIKARLDKNIESLHKINEQVAAIKSKYDQFVKNVEGDTRENLDKFRSQLNSYACDTYGAFIENIEKIGVRFNYELEFSAGWNCIRKGEFKNAINFFEKTQKFEWSAADSCLGIALAQCSIQLIWDYVKCCYQPILHHIHIKLADNEYYKIALQRGTTEQKARYDEFCRQVDVIQKEFERLYEQETTIYDCFICAKITQENGEYTQDCKTAKEIYDELVRKGINPFFSERSLQNFAGHIDEAHILYALHNVKCMFVVCSDKQYLETPWVKNEHTRYRALMKQGVKEDNSIVIVSCGEHTINGFSDENFTRQAIKTHEKDWLNRVCDFVWQFCPEKKIIGKTADKDSNKRQEPATNPRPEDGKETSSSSTLPKNPPINESPKGAGTPAIGFTSDAEAEKYLAFTLNKDGKSYEVSDSLYEYCVSFYRYLDESEKQIFSQLISNDNTGGRLNSFLQSSLRGDFHAMVEAFSVMGKVLEAQMNSKGTSVAANREMINTAASFFDISNCYQRIPMEQRFNGEDFFIKISDFSRQDVQILLCAILMASAYYADVPVECCEIRIKGMRRLLQGTQMPSLNQLEIILGVRSRILEIADEIQELNIDEDFDFIFNCEAGRSWMRELLNSLSVQDTLQADFFVRSHSAERRFYESMQTFLRERLLNT